LAEAAAALLQRGVGCGGGNGQLGGGMIINKLGTIYGYETITI
jgi:hypothetical protein